MKTHSFSWVRVVVALVGIALMAREAWPHVTLKPNQALQPGGFAEVTIMVPNERHVDTVSVSLEVPDAFLKAGGRLSRVEFPPGWKVKIEKEDKPGEIYAHEMDERTKRDANAGHPSSPAETEAERKEQQVLNDMRKKWIKKVTFEGGTIPPDGFEAFLIDFQLPPNPGEFRFPADQLYADGKVVSWSEMVNGAEHPAPSLFVGQQNPRTNLNTSLVLSAGALLLSVALLVRQARKSKAV